MKIAVKELARFIAASGDLSYDTFFNRDENEGQKAHQYLQKKFPKESISEYYVHRKDIICEREMEISGFIDGLHQNNVIEEIKSTKKDLDAISIDDYPVHLVQLKIYAAIYLLNAGLKTIKGVLTYISLNTYDVRSFELSYTKEELEVFYQESLKAYLNWQLFLMNDYQIKKASLKALRFPYSTYRLGQKEFMKAVFWSLRDNKILYGVAPTGIGKTVSSLYPALKLMNDKKDKIFYLTAKTTQKELAINTISEMINKGLVIRLLELTSKEKSCFLQQEICDPENCIYAKNFFGKLKLAVRDILNEKLITKKIINDYALKYLLCPFEFALNVSEYVDVVVADYNYVFDPQVRLIRYFEEDNDYHIYGLIDEAHNLLDRAREMYSDEISLSLLADLKKCFKGLKPSLNNYIKKLTIAIISLLEETDKYQVYSKIPEAIIDNLDSLIGRCQTIFEETPKEKFKNRSLAMKVYLQIKSFLKIYEYYSDNHRFIVEKKEADYLLKIRCLNSAKFTHQTLKKLAGSVLFSATLTPLDYFKELLSEKEGEHMVLPSPFPKENCKLIFLDKIDTYYQNRKNSVLEIIETIEIMVNAKTGNYIVFFPSYTYLKLVLDTLKNRDFNYQIIEQEKEMSEASREEIIHLFNDSQQAKVGFFVMGGMFSEGIDFIGDKLSGVLIVGVAIPQVNYYNELLKKHFDECFDSGFDYAYTYPGFNKVLQAAGRVIRSQNDKGIIVIADKRITSYRYLSLLPSHWQHYQRVYNSYEFKKTLNTFWNLGK